MENIEDNVSSIDVPLFIQEGNAASNEAEGGHSQQRCPNQTDHTFIGEFVNQTVSIAQYLKEMDELLKSSEEMTCCQEYMSTSSINTEDVSDVQSQSPSTENHAEGALVASSMTLTSAGNKLSESMVEYEGQLWNMLGMLESCVEDCNMDTKPEDRSTLSSDEEYVHIPKLFKETAMTPLESSKATFINAHAAVMTVCDQDNTVDEVYVRKKATRTIAQNDFKSNKSAAKLQDDCRTQFEWTESDQSMCETICTEENKHETANTADLLNEVKIDMTGLNFDNSHFETLGAKVDKCIDEVQCLLKRRREVQAELMALRGHSQQEETAEINEQAQSDQADTKVAELIKTLQEEESLRREKSQSEVENLRQDRAKEERKLWRVSVEKQGLRNELWRLKKRLFLIARECAQSQAAQGAQQRHLEILQKKEEELKTAEVQLREQSEKLQQEHGQQLATLQEQLDVITYCSLKNSQEELTQFRRNSCNDVQQYLQDTLKSQEERYGPILIALLKRRDTAVEACAKVKEQTQELRVQLTPLREEIQKLLLQKACLEEKLKLIIFQRKEKMGQYKETVDTLEESCRELKIELRDQKAKTNEMKELKEILNKKLTAYRLAIENHIKSDKETTDL